MRGHSARVYDSVFVFLYRKALRSCFERRAILEVLRWELKKLQIKSNFLIRVLCHLLRELDFADLDHIFGLREPQKVKPKLRWHLASSWVDVQWNAFDSAKQLYFVAGLLDYLVIEIKLGNLV